ncbi:MAG: DNA replication/repair protein RecF [Lachnospiraceae bacterium]|nr:DNA replication/repair protein RecF [Lachnospiraceae bacterium]
MIIRSVELKDFRNYASLSLALDPGINIFYGDNAQGKTNLLEAIFLSCTTKSHKGATDRELIRFGKKEAHVRTVADKDGLTMRIDMHLRTRGAKGVALDGIKMRRASDFLKKCNGRMIIFSPEDLSVIKQGPAVRRRFLDMEISQADHVYMEALTRYQKALSARAAVLKDLPRTKNEDLLDIYDETLITAGEEIMRGRLRFLEEINALIGDVQKRLTAEKETLFVAYEPSCSPERFAEEMRLSRTKDIATAQTNTGPHRDDVKFLLRGQSEGGGAVDLRKYGSQGQQRTAALALKLSEIEYIRKVQHMSPVMLLDDVLSELDSARQNDLLGAIGDTQTIITCTGLDHFVGGRLTINKLFQVTDGCVTAEN